MGDVTTPMAPYRSWIVAVSAIVLFGFALRFVHLDRKIFRFDEIFTALHATGHDEHSQANPHLYSGEPVTRADIQQFLRVDEDKNLLDVLLVTARKETSKPPAYYALLHVWMRLIGDEAWQLRLLSALLGAAALPLFYWLGCELFDAPLAAWLATGFLAVSPVFIRFSQEARPYSIWVLATLLVHIAFLRALRTATRWAWAGYAAGVVVALYISLLSVYVLLGHALYVVLAERYRLSGRLRRYLVASAVGAALFVPWITIITRYWRTLVATNSYLGQSLGWDWLLTQWALNLDHLLLTWPAGFDPWLIWLAVPLLALIAYAVFRLVRDAPRSIWLFLLLQIVVPLLPFVLPDLVLGGQRSSRERYFFPTYLALLLVLGWFLAVRLQAAKRQRAWQLLTAGLLGVGLLSSVIAVQMSTWWGVAQVEVDLVEILNTADNPLVITDVVFGVVAPLSYRLAPEAAFLMTKEPASLAIPAGYGTLYLYQPSPALLAELTQKRGYVLELIYQKTRWDKAAYSLYRMEPAE